MPYPRPASIPVTRPAVGIALLIYVLMWTGFSDHWPIIHTVDGALLAAAHDVGAAHPGWVTFWAAVSWALGPVPLRLIGVVGALVALLKRRVRTSLLLVVCLPLNWVVTTVAKNLAHRPRPSTAFVHLHSASFPSGHALEATASILALLTAILPWLGATARSVAVMVGCTAVVLVGISRVALNVHYPSDVIAGWALGYVYFALAIWVIRPAREQVQITAQ